MNDDLIPFYEHELALLRRSLAEFATRYPRTAAALSISGEHSEDHQVEWMIQSAALLNARLRARIEDAVPEFTRALLEVLYPEYLRPFPSCTIVCFEPNKETIAQLSKPSVIARGAPLKSEAGGYDFQTVYDITLAPLQIADARYASASTAPSSVQLPPDTTGILSIAFATPTSGSLLNDIAPDTLRLYIDGHRPTVAAVIDVLLQRASVAFVEPNGRGRWIKLPAVPLAPAGFGDDEALIERTDGQHAPLRLLLEYFAFEPKFDFLDLDFRSLLRAAGSCSQARLHVPIGGLHPDSATACALRSLDATNFRLSCAPAINLFPCPADPISLNETIEPVYPLMPQATNRACTAVYSIDSVRLTAQAVAADAAGAITVVEPFRSLRHHRSAGRAGTPHPPLFWITGHDARLEAFAAGPISLLAFVDPDGQLTSPAGSTQINADLRCTNRNLPAALPRARAEGDFTLQGQKFGGRIVMLQPPTRSLPRPEHPDPYWHLVSMLSAGPFGLDQAGLSALTALLSSHVPADLRTVAKHAEAIVGLAHESAIEWVVGEPMSGLARGLRVRVTVDEQALTDHPVSTFARVLESVFGRYAPVHGFVQLVVLSANHGGELVRGPLRAGTAPLL